MSLTKTKVVAWRSIKKKNYFNISSPATPVKFEVLTSITERSPRPARVRAATWIRYQWFGLSRVIWASRRSGLFVRLPSTRSFPRCPSNTVETQNTWIRFATLITSQGLQSFEFFQRILIVVFLYCYSP